LYTLIQFLQINLWETLLLKGGGNITETINYRIKAILFMA